MLIILFFFFFFLAAVFLKLALLLTKISGEQNYSNALPHFISLYFVQLVTVYMNTV